MKAIQVLSLMLLSVLAANSQVLRFGRCPNPPVQANFDATRYIGKWYEIQKLPTSFQKGQCATAHYTLKSPGVIEFLNTELLDDGTVSSIVGSAEVKDPAEPAKLEVTFFQTTPGPYWVLSTDYQSHALVYSCTDFGLFHIELSWLLSRKPTMPKETMEELHHILSSAGVDVNKLLTTNQDTTYCSPRHEQTYTLRHLRRL